MFLLDHKGEQMVKYFGLFHLEMPCERSGGPVIARDQLIGNRKRDCAADIEFA